MPLDTTPALTALNLLPGILMIAIGVLAVAGWRIRTRSKAAYFAAGALLWAAAISVKLILDLTVSQSLYAWLAGALSPDFAVAASGLYLGLRTGILECGIVYLAALATRLKGAGFYDAVALGIGFGGAEAAVLGAESVLYVGAMLLRPVLYITLPYASQQHFGLPFLPLPVVERMFTLSCHIFATVLAVYAVKLADPKWLAIAAAFKALLDGPLLIFAYFGGTGIMASYALEAYIAFMGSIALAGLYWFSKKHGGDAAAPQAGAPHPGH